MFGFGPKMSQVFTSRWKALSWSIMILVTAYCTLPMADQTREHKESKHHKGAHTKADAPHKSPWAKD